MMAVMVPLKTAAHKAGGLQPLENKHLASELHDEEGYFQHRVGERIRGRYKVG